MNDNLREIEKLKFVEDMFWQDLNYFEHNSGNYTGYVNENGKPHGKGILTVWTSGNVYKGEFKNDKFDGKGKYTYKKGSFYQGKFKDDVKYFDGKGKLTYNNRDVYEGEFKNDKFDGKGKLTYKNGDVYEGEFKDDDFNGKGKLTYKNGDVYEGEFKNGTFNGKGKLTYKNGDVYEGEFKDNKPHGKGKLTYKNGNVYEGEYKNGVKDGRFLVTYPGDSPIIHIYSYGTIIKPKETTFVDDMSWHSVEYTGYVNENGEPQGKGKFYCDGRLFYEGEIAWSVAFGAWHPSKGKYTYKNGDVYEGEFKDDKGQILGKEDKRKGFSSVKWCDSTRRPAMSSSATVAGIPDYEFRSRVWERDGKGKLTYKNGDVYEGEFKNDKFDGKGKFTYENGTVLEGTFVRGLKNGIFLETSPNGTVLEGEYKNGVKHGIFLETSPNGDKRKIKYEIGKLIYERPIKKGIFKNAWSIKKKLKQQTRGGRKLKNKKTKRKKINKKGKTHKKKKNKRKTKNKI